MKSKPLIIVAGEPNSIFLEIFFKSLKKIKNKTPIILICSKKLFILQSKALNAKINFRLVSKDDLIKKKYATKVINLLDIRLDVNKPFDKITNKSNRYIENCFTVALDLLKKGVSYKLINGPISKKHFLRNKFLGITEYLAKRTNTKNYAMLIFNEKLSVSPITTHVPIRQIPKKIKRNDIIKKIILINDFIKKTFHYNPKFGVTGLNPHCETVSGVSEDNNIIIPAIKRLSKLRYKVSGPFAADTIFMKKNINNFNIIVGMYHDQVLTPIKTLFEYDAINITLGLPFLRVSPDHGPNLSMIGKNKSNPVSLIKAINFLSKNWLRQKKV